MWFCLRMICRIITRRKNITLTDLKCCKQHFYILWVCFFFLPTKPEKIITLTGLILLMQNRVLTSVIFSFAPDVKKLLFQRNSFLFHKNFVLTNIIFFYRPNALTHCIRSWSVLSCEVYRWSNKIYLYVLPILCKLSHEVNRVII